MLILQSYHDRPASMHSRLSLIVHAGRKTLKNMTGIARKRRRRSRFGCGRRSRIGCFATCGSRSCSNAATIMRKRSIRTPLQKTGTSQRGSSKQSQGPPTPAPRAFGGKGTSRSSRFFSIFSTTRKNFRIVSQNPRHRLELHY